MWFSSQQPIYNQSQHRTEWSYDLPECCAVTLMCREVDEARISPFEGKYRAN